MPQNRAAENQNLTGEQQRTQYEVCYSGVTNLRQPKVLPEALLPGRVPCDLPPERSVIGLLEVTGDAW